MRFALAIFVAHRFQINVAKELIRSAVFACAQTMWLREAGFTQDIHMNHYSKYVTHILLLVTALWLPTGTASAVLVTELVDFATPDDSELNLFGLTGTLNTLAQGLGAVDCGSTGTSVQGYIRAAVTLDIVQGETAQLVGVEFLGSSLQQEDISLYYDVPNTTRRVTFSTSNLGFSVAFDNNSTGTPISGQFSTIPIYPGSFDMVQNGGTAKVEITNRPPAVQNLLANPATSIYGLPSGGSGYDQGYLTLYPPNQFTEFYEMVLELPLDYQQVVYTGTGLPVTLNYTGSLILYSELPRLTVNVPEPSALMLSCLSLVPLLSRRLKRTG